MKKTRIYLFGMALMVAMAGCSKKDATVDPAVQEDESSVVLAGKGGGPSANGQGTLTIATTTGPETRHFSFHANTAGNGNVQGSGVLTFTAGGTKLKFDINCLSVVGNVATMTGVITQSNEPAVTVGTGCWFRVVDNGEGSNAPGDQITRLFTFPGNPNPPACGINLNVPLLPVEGGNIQVKL